MTSLSARDVNHDFLPIIDISGLNSADPAEHHRVAQEIRKACETLGFMYVVGHGVSRELREAVLDQTRLFFDLPMEQKEGINMTLSPCNRGYESLQAQTLEPGAPPDLKEGFYIGEDVGPDDPRVVAGHFNTGPNQWPQDMPDFEPVMMEYFNELDGVSRTIMRGLALSLDLPPDYFDDFCHQPIAGLRLLHYPPQPGNPEPGLKGCGAHTDFGGITILMQGDISGLQVMGPDGEWIHAPPVEDSYIVNLGDMIARWTNMKYRSTLHRVVNFSGEERYSVPYFHSGNPDHRVEAIETCLADGEVPLYPPTTVEQHMRDMYAKTYVEAE